MKKLTRRTFLNHLGVAGLIGATTPAAIMAIEGAIMRANAQTTPGGPVGALEMWIPNWPDLMEVGRLLTSHFEKLGITLKVDVGAAQAGMDAIVGEHKVPHMVGMNWGGLPDRMDPDFWLTEFLHSKRAQKGGLNYGHYRSAEYDAMADAQRIEMDLERRVTLVKQAQALAAQDNPSIILLHRTTVHAYNKTRWEGPVPVVGSGIALPYSPWTYIQLKPKTDRKVLRVATTYDLMTTNPFATPDAITVAMLRLIYPPLVVRDPQTKIVPWAAEKVAIVDNTTVDITLRSDMKFQDGKPVTIDDLKFTIDFIKENKFPALARITDAVASIEVTGMHSARIKLKNPSASFVPNVLSYIFIAPKHIWSSISGNPIDYPNNTPIGYGPFKLKEWRRKEFFAFEANKDFFMPPKIQTVIWMMVPNIENQLAMMERGEVDMTGSSLDAEQGKRLAASSDLEVVKVPDHGMHEVRLNLELAPLDNPAVRIALQHATNRKQIVDVVFAGNATVAMNSFISPDLKVWDSKAFPNPDFDIEKGRAVLKAAGFSWDASDKLLYPKG